jgi:DNA (cytosine-5)-methyltransferase 1
MQMLTSSDTRRLVAVDVFSGAGGLTVGLKRAGFRVAAAVELEANAFATYKTNHPEVHAIKQDIRTVKGDYLRRIAGGQVDLLAGCPPCQGFSTLTNASKKRHSGNVLVLEMARLVEEIRPRAVMMENVPGLVTRGKSLFNRLLKTLDDLNYDCVWDVLQVADYGIPQNRRRLVLLASKRVNFSLPPPTHQRIGAGGLTRWKTLKETISGMGPATLLDESRKSGGPQRYNWHVVRRLSPANLARLRNSRPGALRGQLPVALRPKCHQKDDEGYNNVYGRMRWGQLPVTITGGCTTLSKGRFGHPSLLRTISVREAARIQTFPDDYIFDTPYMEHVCTMIGNALPCDFAESLARAVNDQMRAPLVRKSISKSAVAGLPVRSRHGSRISARNGNGRSR